LLDSNPVHKDFRRSRAAAMNIVPTSTGAADVVCRVLPKYSGKFVGWALRVPVPVVSMIDVSFTAASNITENILSDLFKKASTGSLKGIMATSDVPLVSTDYQGNPHSVIVDLTMISCAGRLGKVFGWYDNEYGYSVRLKDFLLFVD